MDSSITQPVETWRSWSQAIREIAECHKEGNWLRGVAEVIRKSIDGDRARSRMHNGGRLEIFGTREGWNRLQELIAPYRAGRVIALELEMAMRAIYEWDPADQCGDNRKGHS